jgi:hypothetical protein
VLGVGVAVIGVLPLASGLPRALLIAAGVLVVLVAAARLLSDDSDYSKEPPVPPASIGNGF